MKKIIKYLANPPIDKLKHFFVGTLLFIGFNLGINEITSAIFVIILACLWEVYRKFKHIYPIDLLDIAFSIVVPIYFLIKNLF